jgi:hypothetical protein
MQMTKPKGRSLDNLLDLISYVILYAPDDFPEEDYLSVDEQMSLARAFKELSRELSLVDLHSGRESALRSILTESQEAYKRGDDVAGAHLLQRFETELVDSAVVC